jgi:hypothetical protein
MKALGWHQHLGMTDVISERQNYDECSMPKILRVMNLIHRFGEIVTLVGEGVDWQTM